MTYEVLQLFLLSDEVGFAPFNFSLRLLVPLLVLLDRLNQFHQPALIVVNHCRCKILLRLKILLELVLRLLLEWLCGAAGWPHACLQLKVVHAHVQESVEAFHPEVALLSCRRVETYFLLVGAEGEGKLVGAVGGPAGY